ncbi:MAG: glycosyltransferase [Bacteroidetes bacterium]|nr:glycosyltransferase [Bacteroidota bacterium]
MQDKPVADISLVVPNYNNGRFLSDFFQSVINSTVHPKELILVDDGSTDVSETLIEQFKHLEFLKIIKFPENRGMSEALNAGLSAAAGKYIMRADPDDILHPDRIRIQYQYMEAHPETSVLGCNVVYFHHPAGKNINVSNFPTGHDEIIGAYKQGVNGIQHPTAIVRGAILKSYRYEKVSPGEDYEIFSRIARDGFRFANLPEPLYRMRVHGASSTSNLTIASVQNIFSARDRIWGTKTAKMQVFLYFYYIRFYRKYQMSTNGFVRHWYLFVSGICFPSRIFKRLIRT